MRAVDVAGPEIREGCRRGCGGECFVGSKLPQAEIGTASKVEHDCLAGGVFFGDVKFEHALIPRLRYAKIFHAHDDHVEGVKDTCMRPWASTWACARTSTKRTSAAVAMLARRTRSAITKSAAVSTIAAEAAAISAKATPISAIATEAAAITAVSAEAATALRCRGWAFELELGCHGLAAVLGNLERHALALAEGLRTGRCQCGDVDEHVRTTTIRKDKSEALGLIEPLYSSSLSHRKPLVLAQVIQ